MKKLFTALLTFCLFFLFGVSASAAASVTVAAPGPETTGGAASVVDWTAAEEPADVPVSDAMSTAPSAASAGQGNLSVTPAPTVPAVTAPAVPAPVPVYGAEAAYQPVNVEMAGENGVMVIKKTYETARDFDPQALVESFGDGGYRFVCREILRRELPGELLSRPASKTAVVRITEDGAAAVAEELPATLEYEENGYAGMLRLDPSSIATEPEDFETYTYAYTENKEIGGLPRNDPSYLDKELDGMALSGVSFTQDAGGQYTATAAYQGTATGKRAVSHVATASYLGEITMEIPGNIQYTLVYEGTPAAQPVPEPMPIPTSPEPSQPVTETPPEEPETEETEPASQETAETPVAPVPASYLIFPVAAGLISLIGAVAVPVYMTRQIKKGREENNEVLEEIRQFIRRAD